MNWQTLLSIVFGGSFVTFIQFLITRYDNKSNQINDIKHAIDELKTEFIADINNVKADIKCIKHTNERERAIDKRVRILRFEDELQEFKSHSKDSFDQVLSDIDDYEKYCAEHPRFKNNQTASTVAHIKAIYNERLEKHDFL